MSKTIILTNTDIHNKIRRIAYQIYEVNTNEKEIILAGIEQKGFIFAQKLAIILNDITDIDIKLCAVTIDKKHPLDFISTSLNTNDYQNKSVVLVDDVLHSGTTLMYAVRHFLNVPLKQLKTAVLVDRNHKKYPIKADFKGISLSTSLQNHVEVLFSDKGDQAYLE
jgi:pyrimidine operon attenuation protein/uracil phosphoribosyltransferase